MNAVLRTVILVSAILLSGCVTTTESRFDAKKDYAKAEQSYIQIGYGYFEQGNLLESKKSLLKALDLNPKSAGAHIGLARVYEQELEYDYAEDHFKKALRYDPTSEGYFQYGAYLYNRGNLKGAYRQFNRVLDDTVYVRRAQTFEFQGVVASRLGKPDEAISFYERAVALNGTLSNSYLGMSKIYIEKQAFPNAYQSYQGFVSLVRAQLARHTAATLWMGIQLAEKTGDVDGVASYSLQLRNRFSESLEYQQFLEWKANKDAA